MIASYQRPYLMLEIRARTKAHDVAVVSPADFETGLAGTADHIDQLDAKLPYCFDAAAERVLYADTPDMARALAAAFLYQGQYTGAQRLLSVPLERFLDLEPAGPITPTFVLSISRCGSTLLSALLRHAGHPSASEPDLYTQVAAMSADQRARTGHAGRLALVRGCTAALARQLGAGVVIKLRDHCNDIAELLAEAVPEARIAFMLRDRLGWANSRHRAFADPPQALADLLARGVRTYDALVRGGHRPVLVWYEDLVADPLATLGRLGVSTTTLDAAGLAGLLSRDAQDGTSISQRNTGGRRLSDEARQAFEAAWNAAAPRDMLRRHGLERLLPTSD